MEKKATHSCYVCGRDFDAEELIEELTIWNGKCPFCNSGCLHKYKGGDSK